MVGNLVDNACKWPRRGIRRGARWRNHVDVPVLKLFCSFITTGSSAFSAV